LYRPSENLLSRVVGFGPFMVRHTPMMPFSLFKRYQSCQKLSRSENRMRTNRRIRLFMTYRLYCEASSDFSSPRRGAR
jgi:hypothetical protein